MIVTAYFLGWPLEGKIYEMEDPPVVFRAIEPRNNSDLFRNLGSLDEPKRIETKTTFYHAVTHPDILDVVVYKKEGES